MRFSKAMTRAVALVVGVSVISLVLVPGVSQAAKKATTPTTYYVSLGDSYSVGYQPVPAPHGAATFGYTGLVAKKLKMTLENFGCGGATTDSILTFTGTCGVTSFGPPAAFNKATIPSGESQIVAADHFITAHAGHIGLVTVSIGGNDVTSCASAPVPLTCVVAALTTVSTNVHTLVTMLTAALNGANVPLVGLTYPDVILGEWVPSTQTPPSPANQTLASESVAAFGAINTALKNAYTAAPHGKFVDVTTATDYTAPLTGSNVKLKNVKPYGKVPSAVATVCKLTYYCSLRNIHENTKGYKLEGKDILAVLK